MPKKHIVEQGENLTRIGLRHGVSWRQIYEAPENAELRELRPDPNVLMPGDELHIPDREPQRFKVRTGQSHCFVVESPQTVVRLKLQFEGVEPEALAECRFELVVANASIEGTTDEQGCLEASVPHDAEEAELTVYLDEEDPDNVLRWNLMLHQLDPVSAVAGVQARLQNLGFECGAHDGELGERTERALRAFQDARGIGEAEPLGPETQECLRTEHQS